MERISASLSQWSKGSLPILGHEKGLSDIRKRIKAALATSNPQQLEVLDRIVKVVLKP